MLHFQEALFTSLEGYEETPLRDRKRDMYGLHAIDNRKRAELVRDVIALGNTTRRFNAPAYLLLGIDNEGHICGLNSELMAFGYPSKPIYLVREDVRHAFAEVIHNYIEPDLTWDLISGTVEDKEVAYLLIPPQATLQPFRVKRQIKAKEASLNVDASWIRRGESKAEVKPRDLLPGDPDWVSYQDRPFLLPTGWRHYFDSILSLSDVAEAHQIQGYRELSVSPTQEPLHAHFDAFLRSSHDRLFVVLGGAGSGKTSFVERLAHDLAEDGLVAVTAMMHREEYGSPQGWIPLYYPLRGTGLNYHTEPGLRSALLHRANRLGQFWHETPMRSEWLFENVNLSWLLILDGLDEIWSEEGQRTFVDSLRMLLDRFPRIKVALTSRPGAVIPDWQTWSAQIVEVAPLSEAEIRSYLYSVAVDEVATAALCTLQSHPDLWRLCSTPSYLAAAMRELGGTNEPSPRDKALTHTTSKLDSSTQIVAGSELSEQQTQSEQLEAVVIDDLMLTDTLIKSGEVVPPTDDRHNEDRDDILAPRLGHVLDQVYRYLWARESQRRGIPEIRADEWKEQAGELALTTDGNQPCFQRRTIRQFLTEQDAVFWLLSLGVLTQPSGTHHLFSFFTELTKLYFAAALLSSYLAAGEAEVLREQIARCQHGFRNQLRDILVDIANQDVSRIFEE